VTWRFASATTEQLNAGINGQLNRFTALFANASYQQRFEGNTYAYEGKLGICVNW